MHRRPGLLMVCVGMATLATAWTSWAPVEDETTVYMLSCDGVREGDVCQGDERTGVPFLYKVSVDEQSVQYRTMNYAGPPRRIPFCTVRNAQSWLCQWTNIGIPKTSFGMVDGRYVDISVCTTASPGPMFYQVSQWRWWLVRWREKVASPRVSPPQITATSRLNM